LSDARSSEQRTIVAILLTLNEGYVSEQITSLLAIATLGS